MSQSRDTSEGRKGEALRQLASVTVRGTSVRTEPGTDVEALEDTSDEEEDATSTGSDK